MSGARTAHRRLRAEWALSALSAFALALAGRALLADVASSAAATRWLLVAGAAVAYEVWFLRRHLDRNRPEGGVALSSLGLPNAVTMVRGFLYAGVAGFLLVPPGALSPAARWLPGVCYGVGAVLDALDGRLARHNGSETVLGRKLDLAFDTLGFLVAPVVGVAWGRLPAAYLSLSAARYLFRAACWWRDGRGLPVGDLPESRVRRPLAAFQMAFIAVALLPALPPRLVHPAALAAVAPSLAVFARDYLAVTGRLPD
jgi:CDP-diacylglycerol--glycerol-3-phosphate 3-phosphatidyltransferase